MSAVARGTAYEFHVVRVLQYLGIRAKRRGGAGDGGVDLFGHWSQNLAEHKDSRQVLVQCKYHSKPLGPSTVRELVAAFNEWTSLRFEATQSQATRPQAPTVQDAAAFIVSSAGLTPSAKRLLLLSPVPLIGVHLPMDDSRPHSIIWNHTFQSGHAAWTVARLQMFLSASAEKH